MRHRLLRLLALAPLVLPGCAGELSSTGSSLDFSTSSEYNGSFGTLYADPDRDVGRNRTTLTMESGSRKMVFTLNVDTMRKGQNLDIASGQAEAVYNEFGKVWVADSGRVRVISELGKSYLVKIEDAGFAPKDEDGEALGTFTVNGTLRR